MPPGVREPGGGAPSRGDEEWVLPWRGTLSLQPFPTEDFLRRLDGRWRATVERGLEPVGQGLYRAGITADGLTVIGLVFAIGTAFLIADGHLLLGVFGVVLTGLPDILDGSVARQSGRAGPRGA